MPGKVFFFSKIYFVTFNYVCVLRRLHVSMSARRDQKQYTFLTTTHLFILKGIFKSKIENT